MPADAGGSRRRPSQLFRVNGVRDEATPPIYKHSHFEVDRDAGFPRKRFYKDTTKKTKDAAFPAAAPPRPSGVDTAAAGQMADGPTPARAGCNSLRRLATPPPAESGLAQRQRHAVHRHRDVRGVAVVVVVVVA